MVGIPDRGTGMARATGDTGVGMEEDGNQLAQKIFHYLTSEHPEYTG